jgi:hypothetical protein
MIDFVHLICDYAPGDMAWAEIRSAFSSELGVNVRLHATAVKSFDTIGTGFVLAQLSLSPEELRAKNLLVFANTAPRKDRTSPRENNEGEGLLFARLKNGVLIVAVNSGYSLSFVREEIEELWSTNVVEEGSQFRSRDYFPTIVSKVTADDFSCLVHKLSVAENIPPAPANAIAYIDSFGNMKTSIKTGDKLVSSLKEGMRVRIKIGSIIRGATVATGSFNVMEGDLAFAPGSSGHKGRYWELFVRSGSAWEEFGRPASTTPLTIEKSE